MFTVCLSPEPPLPLLFSQESGYIYISLVAPESNKSLKIKDLQNHILSVNRLLRCLFKVKKDLRVFNRKFIILNDRW